MVMELQDLVTLEVPSNRKTGTHLGDPLLLLLNTNRLLLLRSTLKVNRMQGLATPALTLSNSKVTSLREARLIKASALAITLPRELQLPLTTRIKNLSSSSSVIITSW